VLLPLHAGYLAKSGVAWSPEEEYRAEDSALKKFVQKMAATAVVLSGGAPTPVAHQCSPNIIGIWEWGICGLMGGAFIT